MCRHACASADACIHMHTHTHTYTQSKGPTWSESRSSWPYWADTGFPLPPAWQQTQWCQTEATNWWTLVSARLKTAVSHPQWKRIGLNQLQPTNVNWDLDKVGPGWCQTWGHKLKYQCRQTVDQNLYSNADSWLQLPTRRANAWSIHIQIRFFLNSSVIFSNGS